MEAAARTLVWIDAREAVIVRWHDDRASVERLDSDVPAHHRATGHITHDPGARHAGGRPQTAGEPRRLEHLERFVDRVARTLAPDEDLLILGPGTVRERLERHVRAMDERHHGARDVTCKPSTKLTDRQLVARLRVLAGDEPRSQTVGAYRWSEPAPRRPSGQAQAGPRRVVEKPPRSRPNEAR